MAMRQEPQKILQIEFRKNMIYTITREFMNGK